MEQPRAGVTDFMYCPTYSIYSCTGGTRQSVTRKEKNVAHSIPPATALSVCPSGAIDAVPAPNDHTHYNLPFQIAYPNFVRIFECCLDFIGVVPTTLISRIVDSIPEDAAVLHQADWVLMMETMQTFYERMAISISILANGIYSIHKNQN